MPKFKRNSWTTDKQQALFMRYSFSQAMPEKITGYILMLVGIAAIFTSLIYNIEGELNHQSGSLSYTVPKYMNAAASALLAASGYLLIKYSAHQEGRKRIYVPWRRMVIYPVAWLLFLIPIMSFLGIISIAIGNPESVVWVYESFQEAPVYLQVLSGLISLFVFYVLLRTTLYWIGITMGFITLLEDWKRLYVDIELGQSSYAPGDTLRFRVTKADLRADKNYRVFFQAIQATVKRRNGKKNKVSKSLLYLEEVNVSTDKLRDDLCFEIPDSLEIDRSRKYQYLLWELIIEEEESNFWVHYYLPVEN